MGRRGMRLSEREVFEVISDHSTMQAQASTCGFETIQHTSVLATVSSTTHAPTELAEMHNDKETAMQKGKA